MAYAKPAKKTPAKKKAVPNPKNDPKTFIFIPDEDDGVIRIGTYIGGDVRGGSFEKEVASAKSSVEDAVKTTSGYRVPSLIVYELQIVRKATISANAVTVTEETF